MALVYLFGAGGHARVVADILASQSGRWKLAGFVDDRPESAGKEIFGSPVILGQDFLSDDQFGPETEVIVTIGDNAARRRIGELLAMRDLRFATAVHPSAQIGSDVEIGPGTVVMANAVINAGARIGKHVIVNTAATIDHDSVVEDFAHIAPGAHLAGHVSVGQGVLFGVGSSAIPGVSIGAGSVIGAGSAVMKSIPADVTAVGVPARVIGKRAVRP